MTAKNTTVDLPAIEPQKMYPLPAIEPFGFGKAALRTARSNGLIVKYIGSRGYVYGQHLIDFILKNGKADRATKVTDK